MLLGNFSAALYQRNEHARAEVKAAGKMQQWCAVAGLVYVPGPVGTCGKESVRLPCELDTAEALAAEPSSKKSRLWWA